VIWVAFIWFRKRTGEGLLWTRQWTFGFHKMLRNSSVAEWLAASQEGLGSMELVYKIFRPVANFVPRYSWDGLTLTSFLQPYHLSTSVTFLATCVFFSILINPTSSLISAIRSGVYVIPPVLGWFRSSKPLAQCFYQNVPPDLFNITLSFSVMCHISHLYRICLLKDWLHNDT
jgi:hypothetical protein